MENVATRDPGNSQLELLPMDALDSLVGFLDAESLLGPFVATSQSLRQVVKRGREERGWDDAIRWGLMIIFREAGDLLNGCHGVTENEEAAKQLFMQAARWGLRQAQAGCLTLGWGCEVDSARVFALFQAEYESTPSTESGGVCSESIYTLGWVYEQRGWDELGMGNEDGMPERDVSKALVLFHEAADDHDNPVAAQRLACIYEFGLCGQQSDHARARKYYEQAVAGGSACAAGNFAACLEHGKIGLDVNLQRAAELLEDAAKRHTSRSAKWTENLNRVLRKIAGTWVEEQEE